MFFKALLNEPIKNERIEKIGRRGMIVIHRPDEIPTGEGHWTGGRMNTPEEAFNFMGGLGAGRAYATVVENSDGTYSVWMRD